MKRPEKISWGHGDLFAGHRTPSPVGYQSTHNKVLNADFSLVLKRP
jgi:hypothetical protein